MERIVVIGSSNVDTVIRVPHIPVSGETVMAKGVKVCFGGKGANQAAAIARLGGDVSFIACVGDDSFGDDMLHNFNEYGVKTGGVEQLADTHSGAAYIYVSDFGDNNIVVNAGANSQLTEGVVGKNINLFDDASYCLIQLEIPIETLYYVAEICREKSVKLILDPAPVADLDFSRLKGTWMITPNQAELDMLVPGNGNVIEKAITLQKKGFEYVLATLGDQGSILVSESGAVNYSAARVSEVVDTTAAGDSFAGTLAFALSNGLNVDESIKIASEAAAITVSRAGAQPSLPVWSEVEVRCG